MNICLRFGAGYNQISGVLEASVTPVFVVLTQSLSRVRYPRAAKDENETLGLNLSSSSISLGTPPGGQRELCSCVPSNGRYIADP